MKEPNWDRLSALSSEIERLQTEGRWNREECLRILDEADKAANGLAAYYNFVLLEAEPEWIQGR